MLENIRNHQDRILLKLQGMIYVLFGVSYGILVWEYWQVCWKGVLLASEER